jgi:nitroreductase
MTALEGILDLARWAPSGDNTQPWRFVVCEPDHITVLGHDTRTHCVYDLDGHASQVALGALLETITIAATRWGLQTRFERRAQEREDRPVFDVFFHHANGGHEDPLVKFIETRSVQRRPLRMRELTEREKDRLADSTSPRYKVRWFEGWHGRWRVASLSFASARIRLTIPEAYEVHRSVIEWDCSTSADRIPSAALGAHRPTLALMRWAMRSWERVDFLNRYLAGTVAPRVELDFIPGLACAAHFVLLDTVSPTTIDDYVSSGRALQRFWLTATALGLQVQPEYTPLVFARYARESRRFTQKVAAIKSAHSVRARLERLLGADAPRAVFMGRIGHGPQAVARSLRLPLPALIQARAATSASVNAIP